MDVLVHLVDEEEHREVEGQEPVAEVCQTVEEVRVLSAEVDGHHVALVLDALRDERLRPRDVADDAVFLPGAEAGGEHEHVVIALEACFDHYGEVSALFAGLVDGDAEGGEPREVHEQIVDEVAEAPVVVPSDDGAEGHTVLTAEGMVAHKGVEASVVGVGQVLLAFDLERRVEIAHAVFEPFYAHLVAAVPEIGIHLVLMGDALQPADEESGHEFCLRSHLRFKYLFDINRLFCQVCHFFTFR